MSMADDYTILNPGVGGDTMDEVAAHYPDAPTVRKRPKVVITGDGTVENDTAPVIATEPAVDAMGLVVRPVDKKSATSATSLIGANVSNTKLLDANPNRMLATIFNESNSVMYVKLGTDASESDYTVQLFPSAYYEVPTEYIGQIDGLWITAVGAAHITELT